MARAPVGRGRLACQKSLRERRAKWLGNAIFKRLDLGNVERTMCVVPRLCSLKKRKWRRIFSVCNQLRGRVFTMLLCRDAMSEILRLLPFKITNPRENETEFLEAQAQRLGKVARAIKRMGVNPDNLETQPWDGEAGLKSY